jgi:hypothetical protein
MIFEFDGRRGLPIALGALRAPIDLPLVKASVASIALVQCALLLYVALAYLILQKLSLMVNDVNRRTPNLVFTRSAPNQ